MNNSNRNFGEKIYFSTIFKLQKQIILNDYKIFYFTSTNFFIAIAELQKNKSIGFSQNVYLVF